MKLQERMFNIFCIILGTFIMAIGIELFLVPNQLSTGGFTGLSTVLYYMTGVSVGTIMLILNIPLFILALFKLGKLFCIRAIFGTAMLSLFLNLAQKFEPLTSDRFLAFLYGSIIVGIGSVLVLRINGSTRWFRYGCFNN